MAKMISTPSYTKEILNRYDLRAKKGFGQNFLVDPVIVDKCAAMSHCEGAVIEIGPGIGSLTEGLARYSKKVVSYEVDESLIPVLQDTLKDYPNVEIILQDFLKCDLRAKVDALEKDYGTVAVCANLPYYITTPVLFRLFEETPDISYITVMVQKEVADRFLASVNSAEYSSLSVEAQYLYNIKKLFNVPARSFNPSPRVDSVIIQFERKDVQESNEEIQKFFTFAKAAFKQRRKTIYNNLKEYYESSEKTMEVLEKAGIDPSRRAQEFTVEELRALFGEK